jgi:hypothetical protein
MELSVKKLEKLAVLKKEIKQLEKLTCRYKSYSDYCEPNYCVCSKISKLKEDVEETFKSE